jgi:hypothetical protein
LLSIHPAVVPAIVFTGYDPAGFARGTRFIS